MSVSSLNFVSKLSNALISFYSSPEERKTLLNQTEEIQKLINRDESISNFFSEYGFKREEKKEVIVTISKLLKIDDLLLNTLCILADRNMLFYINIFLSTLNSGLLERLRIKNIYIYSSFEIISSQKEKIEDLWRERLGCECRFRYAIDKSLKLGIKVQVDTYIEEFSLSANLKQIKIKLDSLFA